MHIVQMKMTICFKKTKQKKILCKEEKQKEEVKNDKNPRIYSLEKIFLSVCKIFCTHACAHTQICTQHIHTYMNAYSQTFTDGHIYIHTLNEYCFEKLRPLKRIIHLKMDKYCLMSTVYIFIS